MQLASCNSRSRTSRSNHHRPSVSRLQVTSRALRAMIGRRSSIEPAIGHMKVDGKLDRNWLKGALGDAIYAALATPAATFG
jgi:hypothetical protein